MIETEAAPINTHLRVRFFAEAVELTAKSATEGRPIFEDRDFVEIRFAGDPRNILVAPAQSRSVLDKETGTYPTYAERFPRHYAAFKAGQEFVGEGTPLKEVSFVTEAKRRELGALHIHTVEALASLDGANLARLGMGGRELKNKAATYIAKASGSADVMRLAGENERQMALIEELQGQVAALLRMQGEAPKEPAKEAAPSHATPRQAAPSHATAADGEPELNTASPFAKWAPDDIKAFISDRTGSKPRGNPKLETLVAIADEIVAAEKDKSA